MPEIKKKKTYFDSNKRKGRLTNVPLGNTGHQSSGKLTKKGQVYKNDLMDVDMTSQIPTRRKLKGM